MKKFNEIVEQIEYIKIINASDCLVSSIEYDSRKCTEGSLFIAIKGEKFDGHNYIESAINNGAIIIVCEEIPNSVIPDCIFVVVESSRRALAEISNAFFDFPSKMLKVIGVTGTNGKTTTTFIIAQILKALGKRVGIIGTTGIYFNDTKKEATHTTPESLELNKILQEMVQEEIEIVVMEVSSHSLEMYRVHKINFGIAIFTNLSHEHLDYHKSMQNYAIAKKKLFDMLTKDSTAILNSDSQYSDFMLENCLAHNKLKVGRNEKSNYLVSDENCKLDGISYNLSHNNITQKIELSLMGKFNIENSALAITACLELGYRFDEIIPALAEVEGAEGRMSPIRLITGAVGIVDYSHTPDALEKALLALRSILNSNENRNGRLLCVFGCGGDRDKTKRPQMGNISANIADFSIITDDNPRTEAPDAIRKDIIAGISYDLKHKYFEIPSRSEAIKYALSISNANDFILIAGKGHEKYQIIGNVKFFFDDAQELKNC